MHPSVKQYVAEQVAAHRLGACDVLDVGSLDVNGSCRDLFDGGRYHGVDMRDGPGVDEICNAHDLSDHGPVHRTPSYDVVLCVEMLEHDDAPWLTAQEMLAVTVRGGWLILTARGYDERGVFPVHGHPDDFYRYSVGAIDRLLTWAGWRVLDARADPEAPGVLALARKS